MLKIEFLLKNNFKRRFVTLRPLVNYLLFQRGFMSDSKKLIGDRIGTLRKSRGLTQSELAERVGLDSRHVSRLETGKHYPSLDSLEAIASVLDVELREFFEFPSQETEVQLRASLVEIAQAAPEAVIRELMPIARNLLGRHKAR